MVGCIFDLKSTLMYLNKIKNFEQVIGIIIQRSAYFQTAFDRKILILGLTNILREKVESKSFDNIAKKCLEAAAYNLKIQHYEELKKRRNGNLKALSDYEGKLITDYKDIKQEMNKEAGLPGTTAPTFSIRDNAIESADYSSDDEDSDVFDYDINEANDIMDYLYAQKNHASMSLNGIFTKIDKEDEFKIFLDTMGLAKVSVDFLILFRQILERSLSMPISRL